MGPKMRTSFTRRKRQRARAHDTRKMARVCNEAKAAKRAAEARDREERSKGVQAGRSTGVGAGVGEKGASGWHRWIAACNNTNASGRSDELARRWVKGAQDREIPDEAIYLVSSSYLMLSVSAWSVLVLSYSFWLPAF